MLADTGRGSGTDAAIDTALFGVDLFSTVDSSGTSSTARGSFSLAAGLKPGLDDFAKATGSQTYIQRARSTLFIPEKFEAMAKAATEINFKVDGFSFSKFAKWVKDGRPELPNNATNMELDYILSNPEIRKKDELFHGATVVRTLYDRKRIS